MLGLPRVYRNLRSRKGTSARANGLPMYTNSFSRILQRSKLKRAEEEDDQASAAASESDEEDQMTNSYAGYPISPPHANYSYHSPTDDEYASMVTPREIVPRQGKNMVRRVSRGRCIY